MKSNKKLDELLKHSDKILHLHKLFDFENFEPIARWLKQESKPGSNNASTSTTTKEK